jgi:hypothetical protein
MSWKNSITVERDREKIDDSSLRLTAGFHISLDGESSFFIAVYLNLPGTPDPSRLGAYKIQVAVCGLLCYRHKNFPSRFIQA